MSSPYLSSPLFLAVFRPLPPGVRTFFAGGIFGGVDFLRLLTGLAMEASDSEEEDFVLFFLAGVDLSDSSESSESVAGGV